MDLLNVYIPNWSDMGHWIPEVVLMVTFLVTLLGDMIFRGRRPWVPFAIAVFGLVTAGSYAVAALGKPELASGLTVMGNLVVVDGLAAFFRILFVFTGLAVVLIAWTSEEIMGRRRENKGEFFALTVFLTAASMVMAGANDLLMLFLSMEAVGLVSYVMAGYMRATPR